MEQRSRLGIAADLADTAIADAFAGGVRGLSDAELVEELVAAGALLRRVEGFLMEAATVVSERSARALENPIDLAYGARSDVELLERVTSASAVMIRRWINAGRSLTPGMGIIGVDVPAEFPQIRAEVIAGRLGLEGVLAIRGPLRDVADRVPSADLHAAERDVCELVGLGPAAFTFERADRSQVLPTPCDVLKAVAVRAAYLIDQDGAEPTEMQARAARSLTVGRLDKGTVPVSGRLLPEVAGQLQTIIDAMANPHGKAKGVRFRDETSGDGIADRDDRTPAQVRHDALATALGVAAASRDLPTLGGAAPTLVVTVDASALRAGRGWAEVGGLPVPLSVAHTLSCGADVQRLIMGEGGQIIAMATEERLFNAWQRRAIATRDGGCIIPGCTVPPSWCEVHHITPWAERQITDVNDGCLLCWYHHHYLDYSGWRIRSRDGVIEVRAPRWLDVQGEWRPSASTARGSTVARRTG